MRCISISIIIMMGVAAMSDVCESGNVPMEQIEQALSAIGVKSTDSGEKAKCPPRIVSAFQDFGKPAINLSCHTRTPLKIGSRSFQTGIGAHANGRMVIALSKQCSRFEAWVGIDNNSDTAGGKGSAQFTIEADNKEVFRSPVCRGGDEPVKIELELAGVKQLELLINDAGDGYQYDQADWADARLQVAKSGEWIALSSLLPISNVRLFSTIPTTFDYNGKNCWQLFPKWKQEIAKQRKIPGGIHYSSTWTQPDSGFAATLEVEVLEEPTAMQLQWKFSNGGRAPSGLITNLHSINLRTHAKRRQVVLHSCAGGLSTGLSSQKIGFQNSSTRLGEKTLGVEGGRSSNGDLPFFILTGMPDEWNLATALGWSGRWRADGKHDSSEELTTFTAGMQPVNFRLPPGETVDLPTTLFMPFKGDFSTGSNLLRRILRKHYQGTIAGEKIPPPISFSSWFVFHNHVNDKMLRELADEYAALGIEYFCLDAGWFEGAFSRGVGNWTIDREKFPNGLKPVADYVHQLGMKFGVWFEPERVAPGTHWAKKYPHLCLQQEHDRSVHGVLRQENTLIDLANPEAFELVLSMMSSYISDVGIDWIRYDFNINPLDTWKLTEGDEEKGLRQIRHVNALYRMLDELMRRHPNLLIEQCAGGGRRIDMETIRHGHTYWKSDQTRNQPLMRFHQTGGNTFLPGGLLNTNYCVYKSQDEMLGLFGGPLGFGADMRILDDKQKREIKDVIAIYKEVRQYINQDYYPLFSQARSDQAWSGWMFADQDGKNGFFTAYRPVTSPYDTSTVALPALSKEHNYRLQELLRGEKQTRSGKELKEGYKLKLEKGKAQVWSFGVE
jgi:alpha-galactosidase